MHTRCLLNLNVIDSFETVSAHNNLSQWTTNRLDRSISPCLRHSGWHTCKVNFVIWNGSWRCAVPVVVCRNTSDVITWRHDHVTYLTVWFTCAHRQTHRSRFKPQNTQDEIFHDVGYFSHSDFVSVSPSVCPLLTMIALYIGDAKTTHMCVYNSSMICYVHRHFWPQLIFQLRNSRFLRQNCKMTTVHQNVIFCVYRTESVSLTQIAIETAERNKPGCCYKKQ